MLHGYREHWVPVNCSTARPVCFSTSSRTRRGQPPCSRAGFDVVPATAPIRGRKHSAIGLALSKVASSRKKSFSESLTPLAANASAASGCVRRALAYQLHSGARLERRTERTAARTTANANARHQCRKMGVASPGPPASLGPRGVSLGGRTEEIRFSRQCSKSVGRAVRLPVSASPPARCEYCHPASR
jgi:hypothetical protein